jgi:putative transposase
MTDTLNDMAAAKKQEPAELDEQGVAEQLVARARAKGIDLVGPDGLLSQLTKKVFEAALEEEMAEHLGYDKHDPVGRNHANSRNGVRSKTLLTEIGPVEIDVPRDVDASFTPQIVKKRQRRLNGVDQIVLSLTARGLTTGEIAAHFAEVYGASVSKETVSKITDKVVEEMTTWANRPLDTVYPVIFVDAIMVKVRDGQVRNKPIYVVIGVTVAGERDILGLWAGDGGEGAKFWLAVLTETGEPRRHGCVHRGLRRAEGSARRDHQRVGADDRPAVHHPPTQEHVPVRVPQVLGPDRARPPAGLHRGVGGGGAGPVRGVRGEVGQALPGDQPAVAQRLVGVRAVPRLRRRDPPDHLLHQEPERPLPPRRPGPRTLPQRPGRLEVSLPRHPIPRPDREGQGTMGDEVEARPERVRHHLRGPDQPGRKLIMRPDQIHRLSDRPPPPQRRS